MISKDNGYILYILRKRFGVCENQLFCSLPFFTQDTQIINEEVQKTIIRNGILLSVYYELSNELQECLKSRFYAAVRQFTLQEQEGEIVLRRLSNIGFDCMGLKGWQLKKFYTKPYMRQMADLDILIKPYDYAQINKVMKSLGYTSEKESTWKHDSFIKDEVHIEMHKRLTDDSNEIQDWEKKMWSRAIPINNSQIYEMILEDFYIYHFIHMYNDFINGSLGLRRIVDTWLLQKEPVDMAFVQHKLEGFGMWTFHERISRLSKSMMGEEDIDESSEILLNHAFCYGIYGNDKSYKAGRIASMGNRIQIGKLNSFLAAVFLPYRRMKAQFPVLKKWPLLLPFCWIKRILSYLGQDAKRYKQQLDYRNITDNDYFEMKKFFEAGGIY